MKFSIVVVSKNRAYTKAYRRVFGDIQAIIEELEKVDMECPIGDSVLIMASDEDNIQPYELVEIPNKDALFQYTVGIEKYRSDDELRKDLFLILKLVIEKVPFANPDHEQYGSIFRVWESKFI
ncbi:hypothetical protein [Xenorhabdus budapestensis]|uniref:Uncharacterized protein n=1 Tax=Xenorhabdus budapestensis TaxID=290110 RepID=A0A2D0J4V5_XENBU|nr:hypothetical protein [Xenorhabdus budapestensis]PHM29580.1 hypothetical protein Xbud_00109 [Xenorhabdus budapestensis]